MPVDRFSDADEFRKIAEPFLARRESEHGLLLGLVGQLDTLHAGALAGIVRAAASDASRGDVVCVALRLDHRLVVSRVSAADLIDSTASDLRDEPFEIVLGWPPLVERVAALSKRTASRNLAQGIYACTRVIHPPPVADHGTRRLADDGDQETLITWHRALAQSIGQHETYEDARASIARRLAEGALHVWEHGSRIVSSAAAVGATPHGIRVNFVYTPEEFRGRGYASALVADLTQALLDGGRAFVFLHTDLSNPISNRLYQRIGYERVGDFLMMELGPRG